MLLCLSSAAAPELAPDALDRACQARGMHGLELTVDARADALAVAERARSCGVRVAALRAEQIDAQSAPALARAAALLGVPLSVPAHAVSPDALAQLSVVFARAGARLLLAHKTQIEDAVALLQALSAVDDASALGLAWDVRPSSESLVDASAVLFASRERLELIRLHGGGPEQSEQDGKGIGPLFTDLALSGYAAPIVLTPSHEGALPRWRSWLESRRSVGCGHRARPDRIELDMRDVEPRDRLETILGTYHTLTPGMTLALTVDHDPSCMYYTLEATEPAGSFAFETLDAGPEVWRVEVKRR